ncbi:MAG: sugar transferase, partial [Oscillospiraceae bacterium]|nr:sugar transferase [Oscillospiraceae bacterium]
MDILIKFRKSVMSILKLMTVISIVCTFIGCWQIYYQESLFSSKGNYVVVLSYLIILMAFTVLYGGFKVGVLRLHEIIYSCCLSLVFTNFIMYLELSLVARTMLNPINMIILTICQFFIIAISDYTQNSVYFNLYSAKHIIAIYGNDPQSRDIIRKMQHIKERYSIDKGITIDHKIREIKAEIDKFEAVLICDFEKSLKDELLRYCYAKRKRIYLLPSTNDIITNYSYQSQIFDTPVLICRNRGLSMEQRIIKRSMDILISSIGILLSSPIMLIIAISIKLYDKGPILFKQNRVTINGKIFNVYKFRSMIVDADSEGAKKATTCDDRITPVGKIIRPLRMDELPQFFNVLLGSMSVVGPRPERTEHVHKYTQQYPEFDLRHRVKGGITGYAQIYGKYNTSPIDKLNMDLIYIENYSVLNDIKLIVMTIKILFVRESSEGFAEEDNEDVEK